MKLIGKMDGQRKRLHFINITKRIDKRLSGIASILSYAGRLIVVNTLIMSMLNFAMCTLKVPLTILDHVENSARGSSGLEMKLRTEEKYSVKW
jgi:hypothetical protein